MSTTITETLMSSTLTRHTARALGGPGGWEVTWLPGRVLTRDQAITAMTIAEAVAVHDLTDSTAPVWDHIDNWAAEFGISGPDAVSRASDSPEDATARAAEEGKPASATRSRDAGVRARDAAVMRERISRAHQALNALHQAWGVWADSVRQDAEARQGVPAGANLQEDREYWLALDAGSALHRAKLALQDIDARFSEAETPTPPPGRPGTAREQ